MDETHLMYFVAATTFAVVLQAGLLIALYFAVRKSTAKMEAIATEAIGRALPTIESAQSLLIELRPKLELLTTNLSESSTIVRNQLSRIDATLTDALDRTRLQVIRADEMLNRTLDKVEDTTEFVHKAVVSPLRHVNGFMAAISTGVEVFLSQKKRHPKNGNGVPQDEMFI